MTTDRAAELVDELRRLRFRTVNEDELQQALDAAMRNLGHQVEREYRLTPRERLDFLVDERVAVEVKVKGPTAAVLRQLARYATHPRIAALVLVTTRMRHTAAPGQIAGKPLHVVTLALSGL